MARILIADPDPEFAARLAASLTGMGHEVASRAASAGQAREAWGRGAADVIFWDVSLSREEGGAAALEALERETGAVPVLMERDGLTNPCEALRLKKPPAFLVKPADDAGVACALETALSILERERALEKSLRLNTLLLDSLPHPAVLVGKDRVILAANKAALRMGAELGAPCWRTLNGSRFLPEDVKRSLAALGPDSPPGAIRCSFCRLEETLERGCAHVEKAVKCGDMMFDFHWAPVEGEDLVLHYAADVTEMEQRVCARTSELMEANIRLAREIEERRRMEGVLMQIAHTVSPSPGDEIFRVLARNMAEILKADYVIIGEVADQGSDRVRTIAVHARGGPAPNFEYDLSGTPCANVVGLSLCIYPEGAAGLFPGDAMLSEMGVESYGGIPLFDSTGAPLGIVLAMDGKAFSDAGFVESILRIFGIRAAAEMERRRSEARVRHSKAMLQTLFDGIPEPLFLFSRDLTIHMLNRSAAAYYQVSQASAVGRPCHLAFRGSESPCLGCSIATALAEGTSYRFERKSPFDADRLEKVVIYPVSGDMPNSGRFIVRISDITEERLLQRQLIQSEKLATLGLLVSGIAHEINNPNNFITFNVPIMKDYVRALIPMADERFAGRRDVELFGMSYEEFREDLFRLLENIEHGSDRINGIVKKLKSFVKMDSVEEKTWFEPAAVIEKGIGMVRNEVAKKVRIVSLSVQENLPLVYTNPMVVEQILINLLLNAGSAADKADSRVEIAASVKGTGQDYLHIEVRDNGCGMDAETRKKLFQPFFTSRSTGEGTGLGLYITKNLIEGLGGVIEVESSPGLGSRFTISLPVMVRSKAAYPLMG